MPTDESIQAWHERSSSGLMTAVSDAVHRVPKATGNGDYEMRPAVVMSYLTFVEIMLDDGTTDVIPLYSDSRMTVCKGLVDVGSMVLNDMFYGGRQ